MERIHGCYLFVSWILCCVGSERHDTLWQLKQKDFLMAKILTCTISNVEILRVSATVVQQLAKEGEKYSIGTLCSLPISCHRFLISESHASFLSFSFHFHFIVIVDSGSTFDLNIKHLPINYYLKSSLCKDGNAQKVKGSL